MTRKKSYQKGNVQLHNGVWTLRYREFDHASRKWMTRREKLGKFKTKKQALKAAEPIMARVNERNNSDRQPKVFHDMTFGQFVDRRWKAYSVLAKHEPSTTDCYGSLIENHLLPRFGGRVLNEITPGDISDFLDATRPGVSTSTLRMLYVLLRIMFDLAGEYDLVEHSPVRPKLHKPEGEKVEKPTLEPEQIRAVLARLPDQERLYVVLLATTGIRMNEGLALRWLDFDEAAREITVAHTLYRLQVKAPKSETSKRTLRLHPAIVQSLASHKGQSAFRAETDFIFCRPDGRPLNDKTIRRHLYRAMDEVGINRVKGHYGFHIFRHTAGTVIYGKSRDLKLVQGALGHSNISTTSDIYVHLGDKVVAEGTELLAEEILGNCDLFVTQNSKMVS